MTTILDRIVETKQAEVRAAKERTPPAELVAKIESAEPTRDFLGAVTGSSLYGIHLIAELKKASPSAGVIVPDFDPIRIARTYYRHGAAAMSVLTDETYFQGHIDLISVVKSVVPVPVLRKDFIIDEYQIHEARAAGADAILLIAEVLEVDRIASFLAVGRGLGMAGLVEVHGPENLEAVLSNLGMPGPEAYILGINNRDLSGQRTDLETTRRLAALLPKGTPFVAESGISSREDVREVQAGGACAILVGESLLRAADIGAKIDFLLGK